MKTYSLIILLAVLITPAYSSAVAPAIPFCPCDTEELSTGTTGNDIVEFMCPGGELGPQSNAFLSPKDVFIESDIPPKPDYDLSTNESGESSCTINEDGTEPVTLLITASEFINCRNRLILGCNLEEPSRPIPTLSEWGLIAMAGILGIVGFIVIRRRNVAA